MPNDPMWRLMMRRREHELRRQQFRHDLGLALIAVGSILVALAFGAWAYLSARGLYWSW